MVEIHFLYLIKFPIDVICKKIYYPYNGTKWNEPIKCSVCILLHYCDCFVYTDMISFFSAKTSSAKALNPE